MTMTVKCCTKCKLEKPITDFYKDKRTTSGLYASCKRCHLNTQRATLNPKKKDTPLRVKRQETAEERKKRLAAYSKEYKKLPHADWKNKARLKVLGIRLKYNIPKDPCIVCKEPNAHAHHPDYSKPLEVVWLCPAHHGDAHTGKLLILPEHIDNLETRATTKP